MATITCTRRAGGQLHSETLADQNFEVGANTIEIGLDPALVDTDWIDIQVSGVAGSITAVSTTEVEYTSTEAGDTLGSVSIAVTHSLVR